MFNDVHSEFILTPLSAILSDGVNACTPLSQGIESSALGEYFLQSLFLRMTGAQEQKLKCICWVMATNDYRYRYELLNTKQYGECSEYKDKRDVYRDMVQIMQRLDASFMPVDILDGIALDEEYMADMESKWKARVDKKRTKQEKDIITKEESRTGALGQEAKDKIHRNIFNKPYPQDDWETQLNNERKGRFVRGVMAGLTAILEDSPLAIWNYREYLFFKEHYRDVLNVKQLMLSPKEFLGAKLQNDYHQIVYEHRNRTAHNTASYLKDVPTLDVQADSDNVYKNYFFRFAILLLIDEVFVRMFEKYRELSS